MDDLTAFLLARIAEDEQAALIATGCTEGGTHDARQWHVRDGEVSGDDGTPGGLPIARARAADPGVLEHITRHDPARVLADCAAKRAIIGMLGEEWDELGYRAAAHVVRLLAATYVGHPDYQRVWVP